ncbi:hypothetical protein [Marivirga sp.]|uniref:hypothetical protein n=1 Tax=Marivirga sp. TaxID=2018662 RepID=UPI003DA76061
MKKTWYQRNKEKVLERLEKKYRENEEFRKKRKTMSREKYHLDADYREKTIERAKLRHRAKKALTEPDKSLPDKNSQ